MSVRYKRPFVPAVGGFGNEVDEAGGIGDELDTVSLRDVAAVRYVRHYEWLDAVLGRGVAVAQQDSLPKPPGLIPPGFPSNDVLKERLDKAEAGLAELQKSGEDETSTKSLEVFKKGMGELREAFGVATSAQDLQSLESKVLAQLSDVGVSVIEKKRIKKINADLGLPPSAVAPTPPVTEEEIVPEVQVPVQPQEVNMEQISQPAEAAKESHDIDMGDNLLVDDLVGDALAITTGEFKDESEDTSMNID